MNNQEKLEEFYNYKYWREIQRNQLNNSSNIIFTFCVAIIGFTINYLLSENNNICPAISYIFFISIIFYFIAIFFYLFMNITKLIDYRKTAQLIYKGISYYEIGRKTRLLGIITWISFLLQIIFSFLGFIFTIICFRIILF